MSHALPKLRRGVTIRLQETKTGKVFIVKEPVHGQFFRFGEAEEFIIRQLDGETPLTTIQDRVREKFGEELEGPVLDGFLATLEASGILEKEGVSTPAAPRTPKRIQGNLLFLRCKFFDPTWIFNRLLPWIGIFFTPFFIVVSAVVILWATDTAVVNAGDLARDIRTLFDPSTIPLYLFFTFVTIGLHEFAHGLTCRHFGGEVHEIGFLLIYFQPALYCNVSDAWLFPEKSKRLWVSFAGPYFELFLWAIAMLLWHATEAGNLLHQSVLMVVAISGVKTLMNFNPLIKLDGYYMLSDFLEIPNLRKKSFRAVGQLFRGLRSASTTTRERRIFLAYGLVAMGGSFAVMGSLFVTLIRYMGDEGGGAFVALPLMGALAIRTRRSYSRMFGGSTARSSNEPKAQMEDDLAPADVAHEPIPELEESKALIRRPKTVPAQGKKKKTTESSAPPAPAAPLRDESTTVATNERPVIESGRKPRGSRRFVWVMGAVIAIGLLLQKKTELQIKGSFNVLPSTSSDVRVSVDGIVDRIQVNEGDRVTAGDLIATLSDRDLRAGLDKTDAEIREASARLRLLRAGPTKEDIAVAETAITTAAKQVEFAHHKVERGQALLKEGLLADSALDDLKQQASAAEGAVLAAQAHLNQVVTSIRPEQLQEIAAQIDKLQTDRKLIEQQMQSLKVVSPASGVVGTPQRQLVQMAGQFVKKGDAVAKINDTTSVQAQMMISEKDISEIKVGQPIELKVRAYPDAVFHGSVKFIATSAVDTSAGTAPSPLTKPVNTILVNTEIDNSLRLLKPEMTGEARIDCGRRRWADLMIWHVKRYFKLDAISF